MRFSGILGFIYAFYLLPRSPTIILRLGSMVKEVKWVYLGTKSLRGVVCCERNFVYRRLPCSGRVWCSGGVFLVTPRWWEMSLYYCCDRLVVAVRLFPGFYRHFLCVPWFGCRVGHLLAHISRTIISQAGCLFGSVCRFGGLSAPALMRSVGYSSQSDRLSWGPCCIPVGMNALRHPLGGLLLWPLLC